MAAVERTGFEPIHVSLPGCLAVIASLVNLSASKHKDHLGIVGRLARDRVPGSAFSELAQAGRLGPANLFRALEFNQAAQPVAGELAEQAALRALVDF